MAEREIIFRGKIINCDLVVSKEWIYGSYCDEAKSPIRLKGEKDYTLCPHISKYDQHYYLKGFGNLGAPYFYEVHPETVGQYTGTKTYSKYDDELHKIFEDDLCYVTEFDCDGNDEQYLCQVVFDCGTFYFKDINSDWCRAFYEIEDIESDVEIVGNIHDNPEILKNPNP